MDNNANLPDTANAVVAPVAASSPQKKNSSQRRMEAHLDKKNAEVRNQRRKGLIERLNPGLAEAFEQYSSQQQQGASFDTMVPVTTRGLGFNVAQFYDEVTKNLPRIEGPPKATINQLYRVTHMQFARQMTLSVPRPKHTRAQRLPERPKISAFSTTRNGIHIADAITQYGSFANGTNNYSTYVPECKLKVVSTMTESEVHYEPHSPGTSGKQPRKEKTLPVDYTIDDPHFLTIFNLRNVVIAMSNPLTPIELRNAFISRSPIPGAVYENGLLTNPNEVIPHDFRTYYTRQFLRDLGDVESMMDQVSAHLPQMVCDVQVDGKGSELNLASSFTPTPMYINSGVFDYGENPDHGETYFFSTTAMGNLTRLRSYLNLMNEAPYVPGLRETFDSTFGIRDVNNAQHGMTEHWPTLAWNICPMRKRNA